MLETFASLVIKNYYDKGYESFSNIDSSIYDIPMSWVIVSLIISICTAYIAFQCNKKTTPASRLIVTIFAFLFSGIYLLYYFIVHILLFYPC